MSLFLYHDSSGTNLVESGDEDYEREAVQSGNQVVLEQKLYVGSDNTNLTYENITLDSVNDEDSANQTGEINIQYAPDESGSPGVYLESISLPNGDFDPPVAIWRKMIAPSVENAFIRTDIQLELNYDEYYKE